AQNTEKSDTSRNIVDALKDSKVSQELLKSVTRKQPAEVPNTKSEEAFLPYDGKIIRKIIVNHIGFEKVMTDTATDIRSRMAKIGNALHVNSKEWVIRDHIFFQEKKPLNPYKLADNERFLRDLDFILDARIFVIPLTTTEDSVDVLILTRDVFSIGGRISPRGSDGFRFRLYDVNVLGMGQRLQYNGYYDPDRKPDYTQEFYYRKSSVFGSLANLTMGYTQLNTGSSYGDQEEQAYYFRLDKPLVSPYSRTAGGIELSKNWSRNLYSDPDSIFRNYGYYVVDVWMGYNIRIKVADEDRRRYFISARFFEQQFQTRPERPYDQLNPLYNSRTSFLGSFTFFKQDFYKTQYVYGFGRTEDVPYGHNTALIAGWQRLMGRQRPYFGVDAEKSFVHRKGNFYTFGIRTGAFPYNDQLQDATILLYGRLFSKLKYHKRVMVRRSFDIDFTYVFNQKTNTLLDINNTFGIEGFVADSLLGTKRLHGRYEMLFYTKWKLLGFKVAPIVITDLAFIAEQGKLIFYDFPYLGLGAGIRTRNENLVFGTIELKCFYYPRTVEDMSHFRVSIISNLRLKYSGSFVRAPSFILYN
ncbi:MAG TPA: hypothetical protein VK589_02615, partial [Chryseolinea sp.]|nr:hypothetical protein [Chryseolinea sp.]